MFYYCGSGVLGKVLYKQLLSSLTNGYTFPLNNVLTLKTLMVEILKKVAAVVQYCIVAQKRVNDAIVGISFFTSPMYTCRSVQAGWSHL